MLNRARRVEEFATYVKAHRTVNVYIGHCGRVGRRRDAILTVGDTDTTHAA